MEKFYIFFVGTIFGSFANVVINRTIRQESVVSPPSHCEKCGHRLYTKDLIPIISFLFLKGRCRYCKQNISKDNLILEIIGGLFALVFFDHNYILKSILFYFAIMLALIIAIIDLKSYDIYMIQIAVLSIFGFIYRLKIIGFDLLFIKNVLIFSLIYGAIYYISKNGLGDGDIYYYFALFLFLDNSKLLYFILISLWLGAISGGYIAIKNKSTKVEIPFCIYIFISFLIINLPGI